MTSALPAGLLSVSACCSCCLPAAGNNPPSPSLWSWPAAPAAKRSWPGSNWPRLRPSIPTSRFPTRPPRLRPANAIPSMSPGSPRGRSAIDLLNLDVIWVPEFAAAGWLQNLDDQIRRDRLPLEDFLPAALTASRYQGRLYALPWFVDAGLLYYRTDLYAAAGLPPPRTFADLLQIASLKDKFNLPYGFLFQGQAYEGLVTVACEFFWGSGGRIFDEAGNLVLDSPENRQALQFLVDLIYVHKVSPLAVTTFLEEDCRHAFEQGNAVAMRNWPYAYVIMNEPGSPVRANSPCCRRRTAPGAAPPLPLAAVS